jgi:hypothetical protein
MYLADRVVTGEQQVATAMKRLHRIVGMLTNEHHNSTVYKILQIVSMKFLLLPLTRV